MNYDPKCYAMAELLLKGSGWNHDATISELAQRIQDVIEDFEADLENQENADAEMSIFFFDCQSRHGQTKEPG